MRSGDYLASGDSTDIRKAVNVVDLIKVKRTYKGLLIKPHFMIRAKHNLPEHIVVPCGQLGRTTARLDEVILKCTFSRLVTLPSYLKLNGFSE